MAYKRLTEALIAARIRKILERDAGLRTQLAASAQCGNWAKAANAAEKLSITMNTLAELVKAGRTLPRINREQRLYILPLPDGDGFTCLGFDVAYDKTLAIATELQRPDLAPREGNRGSLMGLGEYNHAVTAAQEEYKRSGRRLQFELTPQLMGLEGKRVEVLDRHGERRRFRVGRSTGWIPCHLEISRSDSNSGPGVTGAPFRELHVID